VVPLVDLTRRHRRFGDAFEHASRRVLQSGTLLLGAEIAALERELGPALHRDGSPGDSVVAVSSGASGLQLALAALGVGAGDEVVVPAFTAVPTASAVCAVGAVPVPVDVELGTAALDSDIVGRAITARTRAIIVVHLYGRPAAVAPLLGFGVPVVEDAAQAHGALGAVSGAAAVYSFYPTKNVGGIGDGGAVVTADAALAETVRRLRVHGMTEQYVHVDISQNHRMSELEAAWLRLQLPELGADNERRRAIARRYRAAAPHLDWQLDHDDHVVHQCVMRVADRDGARAALLERGINTGVHYPRTIGQQPAYGCFSRHACPVAETWAASCVSLPCSPDLRDDEVERVASALEVVGA
jgi:dTDP-4-amino-4,6-dideoxygalactose transaminase